ncbi:winged helix-turn-helix domain-containing protein [Vibrio vulnificus]|uniref:winged helix-turn-helix domain-containing protein n=1 Tax=Vibrio vulnificus TaxID=672 RepID=UPI001EE9E685|nr:winged helix-turn-helix domain-containing protein [Vibrio vulnificus]
MTSLRRHGYTVDSLAKGSGVTSALQTQDFTAVILDLTLPAHRRLTRCWRTTPSAGFNLPVPILTARDDIKDRVQGLDRGADDYLGKPFALEELLARLRVVIRRQSGSATEVIEVGELSLSLSEQSIRYQEAVLKLTRNEFKILAALMTNAGRVMSKDQLQQSLHGWDDSASDNAIEVHIHNLRKKAPNVPIKNIRGVGYIIEK